MLSLSGSIQLSAAMQTDSDTNDPALPAVRNNTIDVAQSLPNPVTVGGYVAQPMTGPVGQLFNEGDVDDLFRVDLQESQIIELVLGTETVAFDDLDLGLYSTSGVLIDASVGVERIERIVVPASGTYIIRVEAFSGASNYTLSVGQPASVSSVSTASLRDEFVPGQAIVRMKKELVSRSQMKAQADSLASAVGMAKVAGEPDRDMLLGLIKDGRGLSATTAQHTEAVLTGGLRFADSTQRAKYDTLLALKRLSRDKRVQHAEPNRILRVAATPNDPLYARQQWHYTQMNLPAAWDLTTGSASVVVAVVDTGVRPHPDLAAQLVAGFDFVDVANSGDGDGLDADAADPGVAAGPGQYSFHGTHVAGTIGAIGNNGRGVTGVAWRTSLMPVRVLGVNGSGTQYAIQQGIRFASRLPNDSGTLPAKQADIINLSLGGAGSCPFSMQQTLNDATAAGVIVVAAAGNDNTSAPTSPAGCSNVVSVAAVDAQRTKAPYSNFGDGPSVDVAAPGGDESADRNGDGYPDGIFSTYSQRVGSTFYEDYSSLQGTSMAAPHVAGTVALMKAVAPSLTPAQFNSLLASGVLTDDIGPSGPDSLGVGLINAAKAVRAVASGLPMLPGQLTVNPNALNFGATLSSSDIVVQNAGDASVAVSDIQSSAPWLSISPLQVDGNGLGTYRITVNRSGLPSGTYGGTVQIAGSTGTPALVNVLAQVSASEVIADGGMHYLLLIDAVTDNVVSQVNVRARGSTVPFEFSGVATGSYLLVAGTDLNNDSFICDGGEACAAFPNLGRPEVIELTSSRSGLVLTTAYRGDVSVQSTGTGKSLARSQPTYQRRAP
jgi:serine protease